MNTTILLEKSYFTANPQKIIYNDEFCITLFRYSSGVEAIELKNSQGKIIVLPYMGQIIWYAEFKGINMTMKNMFKQPKLVDNILDTYGCFAFHSGLLSNGCPSENDIHPMHGEFCCAQMDRAWLVIGDDTISLHSEYEYCQGFGYHYIAEPSIALKTNDTNIKINMAVKNLTSIPMPLQYMCHINYAYVDKGTFKTNIPDNAFHLRETIPNHIKPTKAWFEYTNKIKEMQQIGKGLTTLGNPELYNTEIVFLADHIDKYTENVTMEIDSPEGYGFATKFSTQEFNHVVRWIMHNGDQQVSSFGIPGTCRPEGFLAAKKAGTLIMLQPDERKTFSVITGLK